MQIKNLNQKDWNEIIELYFDNKKYLDGLVAIEDFIEQFLHRCDSCKHIISNFEMCRECDNKEFDKDAEYFNRNKEYFVYGLKD